MMYSSAEQRVPPASVSTVKVTSSPSSSRPVQDEPP